MSWLALLAGAQADESTWRVWLEAKFLRPAVSEAIPGAQRTILTGGILRDGELVAFSKDEYAALGTEWAKLDAKSRENAAADLAELKPRYERDKRNTIIYGALESTSPTVASAVLAPGFLNLWSDTLGEKILVVVPNRFSAFVFPRLATDYQSYYPMIFRAFRATSQPVSVEVFEVDRQGWRCVGIYQEP